MCWVLDFDKILLGLWTLLNFLVTSWVAFFFNKRLKKFSLRFSYFSEIQIKSLADTYQLLAVFKEKTELMVGLESKNKNPETYKKKSLEWLIAYLNCTKQFSRERYIYPIKIRKKYDNVLKDFNSLYEVFNKKQKIESLFYINEFGEKELGGDYADLVELTDALNKFNIKGVFENSITSISLLLKEIEFEFDNIK
jgi:hypothetical protein